MGGAFEMETGEFRLRKRRQRRARAALTRQLGWNRIEVLDTLQYQFTRPFCGALLIETLRSQGIGPPFHASPCHRKSIGQEGLVTQWIRMTLPAAVAMLPAAIVSLPHDWRFLPVHIALLSVVLALAWHAPRIDWNLRGSPLYCAFLMLFASTALTYALYREAPLANWWIIDDHEIHTAIGPHQRLGIADAWAHAAMHPEICAPTSTNTRYRPTYFLLRIFETFVWGKSVQPWLLARCALFAFTIVLAFDLLRQWLGFTTASIAVAIFSVLRMWPELVVRLGPAETYAAPACAVFAWCAVAILRRQPLPGAVAWSGLAISAVVAMGTKENFLILAPLAILLAGLQWRSGELRVSGIASVVAICLMATLVAGVVGLGIYNNGGRDVYQRSVGLSGLVREGATFQVYAWLKVVAKALPLMAVTGWLALKYWRLRAAGDSPLRTRVAVGLVLVFVAWSQFFFYRGEVFRRSRYDLPFVPIVGILAIGFLEYRSRWPSADPLRRRALRRLLLPGALALTALALGGDRTRHVAHAHREQTNVFAERMQAIIQACRKDQNRPVVFVANTLHDFEPVWSFTAYLRGAALTNPIHLRPVREFEIKDGLARTIRDFYDEASSRGHERLTISPWASLAEGSMPIEVWFSVDPPEGKPAAFRGH
jgi:hypothetical protein